MPATEKRRRVGMPNGVEERRDRRERPARRRRAGTSPLFSDMLKGAIAGAIGVVALDAVTWAMWDREDRGALRRERAARPGGMDPAHVLAHRMAAASGATLTPMQPHPAGIAVHYGLGILPGAAYGVLRRRVPAVGAAAGMAFGLTLFLLQDEGMNAVLGTSAGPGAYPWQAHARGAVGHLVLGAVTDAALGVLDRVFEPVP